MAFVPSTLLSGRLCSLSLSLSRRRCNFQLRKQQRRTSTNNSTNNATTTTNPKNSPSPERPCESPADSQVWNAPKTRGRDDDALSRFPHTKTAGGILRGLDYAGTVTFAITGSVTAAQSGLDVFGCSMAGMITAVGGGTIRDTILLGKVPFWTSETEYIWMTIGTGCATFFLWPYVLDWQQERRKQKQLQEDSKTNNSKNIDHLQNYDELDAALDSLDAIGLAAFAIIGAQNGIRAGMPMVVSAICGMATSTFGGLTRDVLCGRPVRIVHSNAEVYAQPALLGAMTYLYAKQRMASPSARIFSALAVCITSRYIAVKHNVKLHTWDTQNDGLGIAVRK